jgi:hypothetical protein
MVDRIGSHLFCTGSLLDCGFDACSSDSYACQSTITNMASEVGMSIASIAALIATGGAAAPLQSAGKAMTNRMSAVAIRLLQRSTVNGLRRSGKQMFKKASTKQGMNAFTKKHIVDAAKAGWTENMVKGMCNKIASSFYDKLNPNPAPFNVDWLDPTGIATAVTSCKDGALSDPEDTACKAAILSAMSTFDPTGLMGVAAAFMHEDCKRPSPDLSSINWLLANNPEIVSATEASIERLQKAGFATRRRRRN